MNHAILLSGGRGTRFWPISRNDKPKQFLDIYSSRPMVTETFSRIKSFLVPSKIYVATNKIYRHQINRCLKGTGVLPQNILFEPESKDTLAPIGLLTKIICHRDKEAVILVFPCDHYIKGKKKFLKVLNKAVLVAEKGYIVTLGIAPGRPTTDYGYIKVNSKFKIKNFNVYKVKKFIEKPEISITRRYIRTGTCYWNSGIFIFRADCMLKELKKYAPNEYRIINKIHDKKSLNKFWPKLKAVSIDYAIMQRSKKLALLPVNFSWRDLGSWQALESCNRKDKSGNILKGNCVDLGSKNTFVFSDMGLLATIGLNDLIVVNAEGKVLVCAKNRVQELKRMVESLRQKGFYK